jgi:hypothetical protein
MAATKRIVVVGQVTDDAGAAVSNALVRILENNHSSGFVAHPVNFDGKFERAVDVDLRADITCEIIAVGFESQKRTLVIDGKPIDIGIARLNRVLGLRINGTTLNDDSDGTLSFLDVAFTNESKQTITVVGQRLLGTARAKTECSDASPSILFTISGNLEQITLREFDAGFTEKIAAQGKVEFLPCKQTRIDLQISIRAC